VRVLWVDGEEFGMVGSNRYLQAHPNDNIAMVVNADMTAFMGTQSNPLTHEPAAVEYWIQANEQSASGAYKLAQLAGQLPEPVGAKPVIYPGSGVSIAGVVMGYSLSDQSTFWMAGIPALFPFPTGDIPDWYHTPRDVPAEVDVDRLQRVARLWVAGLAAFATVAP
jgi:Zn-dependent M28 family amino/carboxypeptidase